MISNKLFIFQGRKRSNRLIILVIKEYLIIYRSFLRLYAINPWCIITKFIIRIKQCATWTGHCINLSKWCSCVYTSQIVSAVRAIIWIRSITICANICICTTSSSCCCTRSCWCTYSCCCTRSCWCTYSCCCTRSCCNLYCSCRCSCSIILLIKFFFNESIIIICRCTIWICFKKLNLFNFQI